ncbi:hypothetical protein PYW07_011148 [Mythimna separata]|uniref:BESS domain-containing protein n=1 Tax=Mythimna separata TaxID=271217 RepID=A0AAD7Y7B8_MYTSE|nr:hypothetical protein PYW07_011148 [Mythimna separata]
MLKDEAWHEICRILNKNYDNLDGAERQNYNRLIGKIWRHIRDSWARSINARKKALKIGVSVRPYKYDKEMSFLRKVKGPSKNTIGDGDKTEDEEDEEEDTVLLEVKNYESGSDSAPGWDHDYECIEDNSDDEWNIDSKEGIITTVDQDNAINEIDSTVKRKADNNTVTENSIDSRVTMYLNQMEKIKKANDIHEDRHYSFFRSVHPSLTSLDDDQVLEFQSGVINLLRNIKRGGRMSNAANNQPCSSSSRGLYVPQEVPIIPQQPVVAPRVTQTVSSGSAGSSRTELRIELDPLKTD